jgi:hypothetical protein
MNNQQLQEEKWWLQQVYGYYTPRQKEHFNSVFTEGMDIDSARNKIVYGFDAVDMEILIRLARLGLHYYE